MKERSLLAFDNDCVLDTPDVEQRVFWRIYDCTRPAMADVIYSQLYLVFVHSVRLN